jgi:uncharacterized membrane protein YhaH (DUF805 family)
MSTPNGQPGPYGPNPHEPAPQPSQASGQGTYGAEEDIPRQQGPHEDQHAGQGQHSGQAQGQDAPGQGGPWAGGQQGGTYGAYPSSGGYGPGGGYPPGGVGPLSYLQGAPVGFADAIRGAMTNIVTLRGRASRSAFWWFALLQFIVYTIISWISDASTAVGVVLDIIIGIPLIVAGIALAVRRLHDTDRTGWWWWIGFVPFIGWIVLLVFYLLRGTPGPNRYSVAG